MEAGGWCPRCGAEYRPGFTVCADCRVDLVDHPPAPATHPQRRLVELTRVPQLEARMLVNRLRAAGAESADIGAEPIYASFDFAEGIPVLVADDELNLARRILSDDDSGHQ